MYINARPSRHLRNPEFGGFTANTFGHFHISGANMQKPRAIPTVPLCSALFRQKIYLLHFSTQPSGHFSAIHALSNHPAPVSSPRVFIMSEPTPPQLGQQNTNNPHVLKFVEESAQLCAPDLIFWCDGSEAEK